LLWVAAAWFRHYACARRVALHCGKPSVILYFFGGRGVDLCRHRFVEHGGNYVANRANSSFGLRFAASWRSYFSGGIFSEKCRVATKFLAAHKLWRSRGAGGGHVCHYDESGLLFTAAAMEYRGARRRGGRVANRGKLADELGHANPLFCFAGHVSSARFTPHGGGEHLCFHRYLIGRP